MADQSPEPRLAVVELRLDRTERALEFIAETLKGVLRIESQSEAFGREPKLLRDDVGSLRDDVKALRGEIEAINAKMQQLRETRGWVVKWFMGIVGAVLASGLALIGLKH